jgi:diguanylate cyclase (GGDEF)-like protein
MPASEVSAPCGDGGDRRDAAPSRSALARRVRRDRLAVAVFAATLMAAAIRFEAFETYTTLARGYERFQLDELVSLLAILPVALVAYIWRRHRDLRGELAAYTCLEEELRFRAEHDALTGLRNRRTFTQRLISSLGTTTTDAGFTAVLLLDLNHFKEVRNTLGHHIGDELLREVGDRLRGAVRPQDTVARMGRDEFAVLLTGLASVEEAEHIAERLQDAFVAPVLLPDLSLPVEACLGIAVAPVDGADAALLMQRADIAMNQAKRQHSRTARYHATSDTSCPERLVLLGELRFALDFDELILHFQPKVELATGRVRGVEALVRWEHPVRGLLFPDVFIPAAEQTGLIRPLALRVLDLALAACQRWRADGLDLTVAVNLSARNLLDLALPTDVRDALARHGLPASSLELEITESMAMADPVRAMRVLGELHAMGVLLTIDDYGTGHSSLAYLQRLPVDHLKIDKSFVTTMTSDGGNAVIVRSTVELARHLGLDVIAEGVEDQPTVGRLLELGCHSAQGYGLGRPAPAEEIPALIVRVEALLREHHAALETRASRP